MGGVIGFAASIVIFASTLPAIAQDVSSATGGRGAGRSASTRTFASEATGSPAGSGAVPSDSEARAALPDGSRGAEVQRRSSPVAELSEEASFARAALHFDSGRYAECANQFEELLDSTNSQQIRDVELVERARVYRAACLLGMGKTEDADKELERAIRLNPQMGPPDLLVFPQAVVDRFLGARERLMKEIRRVDRKEVERAEAAAARVAQRTVARQRRIEELEYLASQEVLVRQNSRWIALLPFGTGQFQNGQNSLGWFFLGGEFLLGAGVVGSLVADSILQSQRDRSDPALTGKAYYDAQMTAYSVLIGTSWGFIGLAGIGIAQAQISFVPDTREIRGRPLPAHLRQKPSSELKVSAVPMALPNGAGIGLLGLF